MRILFAGHKERGAACLAALLSEGYEVVGVLAHHGQAATPNNVVALARQHGLPLFQPTNVNDDRLLLAIAELRPSVTALAGYAQIANKRFIELAPVGCVNLHAGKLPQYRGSSPLNWVLIRGEVDFTLSIIQVDTGVDTGDVLAERTFPIGPNDTIADLHGIANSVFPRMLVELLPALHAGTAPRRPQQAAEAAYYPIRFPDDGLIVWELMSAQEVHNRIRALTDPYPGAFTFLNGQRIKLLASRLAKGTYRGESGRVYRKTDRGLLVCASDRCLWIERATVAETGVDAWPLVSRYSMFATLRGMLLPNASETPA